MAVLAQTAAPEVNDGVLDEAGLQQNHSVTFILWSLLREFTEGAARTWEIRKK